MEVLAPVILTGKPGRDEVALQEHGAPGRIDASCWRAAGCKRRDSVEEKGWNEQC